MQFGKTDKQRSEKRAAKERWRTQWVRWFAWKPIRLHNGRWAWLEIVEYTYYQRNNAPSSRWTYRISGFNHIVFRSTRP